MNSNPKNIVICLDGTGNQFKEENTNVVKLFRVLEKNRQEQIAYYDPGVGTLADPSYKTPVGKKISKVLGLAFGRGLTKNISQAYSYLMENYDDRDRIFLFGFSRGAYTARALAGFINACGLLEKGCQNLIPYAMKLYESRKPDFKTLQKFKSTYGRKCNIHFMGLWDTVRTVGWIYDPVFLPFTTNNRSVQAVRHALAIDERRAFYRQVHWGQQFQVQQDIKEVWFAGVHSDVGGGYPEEISGLSKITLQWMIQEASLPKFGLKINKANYNRYVMGIGSRGKYVPPDAKAVSTPSLKGLWWVVQYIPQKVWMPLEARKVIKFPEQQRPIAEGATIHQSVLTRISREPYKPANLASWDEAEIRKMYDIEQWQQEDIADASRQHKTAVTD